MPIDTKMEQTLREDIRDIGSFVSELARESLGDSATDSEQEQQAEDAFSEKIVYATHRLVAIKKYFESRADNRAGGDQRPE